MHSEYERLGSIPGQAIMAFLGQRVKRVGRRAKGSRAPKFVRQNESCAMLGRGNASVQSTLQIEKRNPMRIVLTGGSGDLGRILCPLLVQQGDVPVVLDVRPPSGGVEFINASITDRKPCRQHCQARIWSYT